MSFADLLQEKLGEHEPGEVTNFLLTKKNRLKSYFTGTVMGKTKMLVEDIDDFEYIVTSSELESLILEITLIKKYDPKYNIMLTDDKSYPYIELTKETYPRLRVVRNVKRKKSLNHLY